MLIAVFTRQRDFEIVQKTIPLILSYQTDAHPSFCPLHTLDSILDLLLTCKTPEFPASEIIDYLLPYLGEKICAANLQPEVQPILLWKLVGVSRDILANNEREHFMGVIDALMDGMKKRKGENKARRKKEDMK